MKEVPIKQRKKKIARRKNAEMREGKTGANNGRGEEEKMRSRKNNTSWM